MDKIQLKRGNAAQFSTVTLSAGEPAYILDTNEFYIGDGTLKKLINSVQSVSGKTGVITLNSSDVGLGNVTNESKATMFTSPTFTGIPITTTAAADTTTTQVASTAFVIGQASSSNPLMNGTVAIGTSKKYARADHVHGSDTTKVNTSTTVNGKALSTNITITSTDVGLGNVTNESKTTMFTSPTFTGVPTVPTAAAGTSTTQAASTAFVATAVANAVSGDLIIDGGTF